PVQQFHGALHRVALPRALADGAKALSKREETTVFMTLLAAFKTLLCLYSGQQDLCVGTPIVGRPRTETEGLIGFFANTLVLRTPSPAHPPFRTLLPRARKVPFAPSPPQALPFEKLVELLQPPRDPSRNPLFQVNFRVQTDAPARLALSGL